MAAMAKNLLEIFKIISYSISLSSFVNHKAPFRFLNFFAVVFLFSFEQLGIKI
jgi:hypothetical protein